MQHQLKNEFQKKKKQKRWIFWLLKISVGQLKNLIRRLTLDHWLYAVVVVGDIVKVKEDNDIIMSLGLKKKSIQLVLAFKFNTTIELFKAHVYGDC